MFDYGKCLVGLIVGKYLIECLVDCCFQGKCLF